MIARRMPPLVCFITLIGLGLNASSAEPPKNPIPNPAGDTVEYGTRIPLPGIVGTIVLAGGGQVPIEVLEGFLELAGGENADILVLCDTSSGAGSEARLARWWRANGASSVQLMAALPQENDGPGYGEAFDSVQGIWIDSTFDLPWNDPRLAELLHAFLDRGGIIGAQERSAEWLTDVSWSPDDPNLLPRHDARLLPGAVLNGKLRWEDNISKAFIDHANFRGRFTIGLEDDTVLIVRGRRAHVVGEGEAVFGLGPSRNRPMRVIRQPDGTTVDIIALSRAAVARAGEEFPARVMRDPVVESGTLFIGGGGAMPEVGMKRFIEASGGPDALIIVIPTAIGSNRAPEFGEHSAQGIRDLGANNVIVIHTLNPREADTDAFCEPFRTAGGIWFTGGRQWNLVDAYRGTLAHQLMHEVLKRGRRDRRLVRRSDDPGRVHGPGPSPGQHRHDGRGL